MQHRDWEREIETLRSELEEARAGNAKVIRALDASAQLIEALLIWMPEGLVLSEQVKHAKATWTHYMREIRR